MDVLKGLLEARQDKTPQVQALLDCLAHPSFNLQVCICSVGGVGSTELGNFLTRAGLTCNLLTDQDATRHAHRPPAHVSRHTRVVYLFGDPLAAVASHYRRGHAFHQAQKTSGGALRMDEAAFPSSFQAYVDRGEDLFGLAQHLHNWLSTPSSFDVLFVRYEAMFDPLVTIAMFEYLCQPHADQPGSSSSSSSAARGQQDVQQLAATFAASKRQRASQVTQQQRQAMYQQLAAEMDALPPIFLRSADCTQRQPLVVADTAVG